MLLFFFDPFVLICFMIGLGILISSIVVPFSQSRKHQIIGFALNCAENWLDFSFSKKSEQEELKFIKEK